MPRTFVCCHILILLTIDCFILFLFVVFGLSNESDAAGDANQDLHGSESY